MTATDELRRMLDERGVRWEENGCPGLFKDTKWHYASGKHACFTEGVSGVAILYLRDATPEQTIAATVGRDERESYDAGFASGVKATLQQLYGLLHEYPTLDEIEGWADIQWEEYE